MKSTPFRNLFSYSTKPFFVVALCVLTLTACKKEKTPVANTTNIEQGNGVFIGNEGAFLGGNASVMYYRFGHNAASGDLFKSQTSEPLGDVMQSMFIDDNRLYMVVSNSNKIESMLLPSLSRSAALALNERPRYLTKVDTNVAFATNFYSNTLTRLSLTPFAVTGTLAIPNWGDALIYHQGKLFVTAPDATQLFVCDPESMQTIDSVSIGTGGNGLVVDKDGMLWVFAAGRFWLDEPGALVKINPVTLQIENMFELGVTAYATGRLCANAAADSLYFLNGDVFRMSIYDTALPQPFIVANGRNFYGLYRHPDRPFLFVTDAKDFAQNGDVYLYGASSGVAVNSFNAGVAPSTIVAY